jgi:hypothetical protein
MATHAVFNSQRGLQEKADALMELQSLVQSDDGPTFEALQMHQEKLVDTILNHLRTSLYYVLCCLWGSSLN